MSSRASAARYARALFDVAVQESEPGQIEQELSSITALIKSHSDLQKAIESPSVPPTAKKAVVEALVQRGQFNSAVAKLLVMLAERDRLVLLPEILEAFQARLREQRKVLEAEVTTAIELEPAQQAALQQRLSAATAREVTVTTKVDPEMLTEAVRTVNERVAGVGSVWPVESVARTEKV